MKPAEPFEQLAADVQADVRRVAREVQARRGGSTYQLSTGGHDGAARLAVELHQVLATSWRHLATTEQIRNHSDRVAVAVQALDEFTTATRADLEAVATLLGDLEQRVGADERRRAEESVASARRRQLDVEVDRLAAAEDAQVAAERRQRLEDQARERLEVVG